MKFSKVLVCTVSVILVIVVTGCSNVVRPVVSQSEFSYNGIKNASKVALHITDEFREYEGEHVDWWCDATSYKMQIGPLASDWFKYALESRFETVKMVAGMPSFPYSEDVDFVVTPEFTSFKAGGPVVVKLEAYWVELEMTATIQDRTGKKLNVLELKEKGSQGGTPGFNPGTHIYPEVCRLAVKPLVDKTIEKIVELGQ